MQISIDQLMNGKATIIKDNEFLETREIPKEY